MRETVAVVPILKEQTKDYSKKHLKVGFLSNGYMQVYYDRDPTRKERHSVSSCNEALVNKVEFLEGILGAKKHYA